MKNNSKSIRMSDVVLNYIMSYPGNGFNEKFENIILYAMESEEARAEELKRLDNLISDKRERLEALSCSLRSLEPLVQGALHVNSRIRELDEKLKECISDM